MPKRIVYTRHDGGVSVCAPSGTALAYMTGGGGRWNGYPRGFLEWQIAAQAADGAGEDAARRFVMAMQFGGLTTAEAYDVMRARFCEHLGTCCEMWDTADVPRDRWFRDAWRRSANGGPIMIDLGRARRIQLDRIKGAVSETNERRIRLGRKPITPAWIEIGKAIRRAGDEDDLRRVWPKEIGAATHV